MRVFQRVIILTSIYGLCEIQNVVSPGLLTLSSNLYGKGTFLDCTTNSSKIQNVSAKLKAMSWEHNTANIDFDVVGIIQNITVQVEGSKYTYTNQFRPFLVNVSFNLCELFDKDHNKNPYIQTIFSLVSKYSNVNHKCPYSGHVFIHGFYVNFDLIPFYIPIGTYKLVFHLFYGWPYTYGATVTYIFKIAERNSETKATVKNPQIH